MEQKTTLTFPRPRKHSLLSLALPAHQTTLKTPHAENCNFSVQAIIYAQISGLKRTATRHLHHTCTPWWNVNIFEGNTQTNPTIYIAVFVIFLVHTLHVTSGAAIFTLVMYRIWLPRKRSFLQTTGFQHPTTNSIS